VTVPAFRIDLMETPVAHYQQCVAAGACGPPLGGLGNYYEAGQEQHPVNYVQAAQAAAFCGWVGKRLCSESEWEKASRGGCEFYAAPCQDNLPTYPWGSASPDCTLTNMSTCEGATRPVDTPGTGDSAYGVVGMGGNISEWVADCEHGTYAGAPADGSAWLTDCAASGKQVARGGAFSQFSSLTRSSARRFEAPNGIGDFLGIRCCADP
jgi:formylglycine-generating enzyme required for sulfatase activity